MKRLVIILAAVMAVAFCLVGIAKRKAGGGTEAAVSVAAGEKERVQKFWAEYNRANELRTQRDYSPAVEAYREALELDPRHEDSLYYMGTSLEELGNYRQATATFERLLEANPSSGRGWGELGNSLSLLAPGSPVDFSRARQAYRRNLEVNREQAGPFLRLGMLDLNQARTDAALGDFRIAAGFGSPDGNFLLGYTLFLKRQYREAIPYFLKVLDADRGSRKIIRKGVLSEGDLHPTPGKPLTALQWAGMKSVLFLYWAAVHAGGYPPEVPKEFQIRPRLVWRAAMHPAPQALALTASGARTITADFEKNGGPDEVIIAPGQPLKFYRRRGEQLVDATQAAGLKGVSNAWDTYVVDYDGDGYPDLYVVRSGYMGEGQNQLFHNNHNGTFSEVTRSAGLEGVRATARACFGDFDGDGRVDLVEVGASAAAHGPVRFYRNVGGHFVEATDQSGLHASGTAVDCSVADFDRDGKPDLFVLYWKQDAALYRNLGNGKLANVTERAGLSGIREESFSAIFFDYNKDGLPDLLVTAHAPYDDVVQGLLDPDLRTTRSTPRLFRNQGNGAFREVTEEVGLTRGYGTMQALAADIDGDGWPDLLLVNGSLDALRLEPSVVLQNHQGRDFRPWFYLPDFDRPGNNLAGTLVAGKTHGAVLTLSENPLLPAGENRKNPDPPAASESAH